MAETSGVGIIASLKLGVETVKAIVSAESTLERAELRAKAAELTDTLVDARMAIVDAAAEIASRDARILELQRALEIKGKIARSGDAYYMTGDSGAPNGHAYCIRCWEADHQLRSLVLKAGESGYNACPGCRTLYDRRSSMPLGNVR
jgi:hypothetical protein